MKTRIMLTTLMALVLSTWSGASMAGAMLLDKRSSCTGIDCNSRKVSGQYEGGIPFVVEVFAKAGECLRLSATRQTVDLEMAVISPDVQENHWVDDDSGGSFRPLIKINPTPVRGYYIVILSHVVGSNVRADFDVRYGRYPAGNPNCSSPTPPSDSGEPGESKAVEKR